MSRATDSGKLPGTPLHKLHMTVAGIIIKWCITIAQKICFIYFESLYPSVTIVSLKSTLSLNRCTSSDFDHYIQSWKNLYYTSHTHWACKPLVASLNTKKKSGCFCHKECHWRDHSVT